MFGQLSTTRILSGSTTRQSPFLLVVRNVYKDRILLQIGSGSGTSNTLQIEPDINIIWSFDNFMSYLQKY